MFNIFGKCNKCNGFAFYYFYYNNTIYNVDATGMFLCKKCLLKESILSKFDNKEFFTKKLDWFFTDNSIWSSDKGAFCASFVFSAIITTLIVGIIWYFFGY